MVFEGNLPSDFSLLKEKVSGLVNKLVKNNHLIQAAWKDNCRTIHFAGFTKSYPCGGTHVKSTSEIGEVIIRNVKKNKQSKSLNPLHRESRVVKAN